MKIGTNWIDDGGRLNGTIGLETLNSVIAPIIKAGCEVPDRRARIFGTTEDNQDQIIISMYFGTPPDKSDCVKIADYRICGIPPLPRGEQLIEVFFIVTERDFSVQAMDRLTGNAIKVEESID